MSAPPDNRPRSLRKRVWVATRFIRFWLMIAARLQIFTRVTKTGTENIPKHGAVLICPNHRSLSDPLLLFGALRRNVAFFATSGLFRIPILGFVLRWMGHISVARGTDAARQSIEFGMRVLEYGGVAVNFGEGGCSRDGALRMFKGGPAEMAFRSGAPVIPTGMIGTARFLPLGRRFPRLGTKVEIHFGEPIYAPYRSDNPLLEDRQAFTNQLMEAVAKLSNQELPQAA